MLVLLAVFPCIVLSWVPSDSCRMRVFSPRLQSTSLYSVDFDSLMTMDVVVYSEQSDAATKRLGAIQEDGRLTPLSVWSTEPVFGESLEFLVDEDDLFPGFDAGGITVHSIVPEDSLSYGSRQVGGGKGPGNPHGEESELLYYVDKKLTKDVELTVRPELEITW